MDTTVKEIGERVVAALEDASHAKLTIVQYRNAIRSLGILALERGEGYSPALGAEFAVMTADPLTGKVFSPKPRSDFARLARVFNSYVFTGQVDLSMKNTKALSTFRSQKISPYFWPIGLPTRSNAV